MSEETKIPPVSALKLTLMAKQVRAQAAHALSADPVAIVGMGCRVPGGGDSPEQFWELLRTGVDCVREVPADRWDAAQWYDPDLSATAKVVTRSGGFLQHIDGFDASYFGILPREAERMDPQQRLFLEVAIEALDDAGLTRNRLRGSRTGVFIASYHNDYTQLQYSDLEAVDARTLTGTLHSVLANRLSYFLDLHGPSLSIDTACSSSLVAIHLACQSLRYGESDVAVAGGVSLIITPELMVSMSKVGFMAPDGRCKTFDERADGFGRGEGCGLIVLKRLSDALADGDRVLAVVRGSAVNQDGHSTLLAAPHGPAQEALIRDALANAQLEPGRIGYIEAHGTGTALGDPIEVEAIAAIVGRVSGAGPCLLGSAKANLGHLEAAAGVTGLIKAVLSLRHEAVPPQVHFNKLSPHISLAGTRLAIPATLTPWPASAVPRCAGVSSFGVGGTNAHVIIEEAPRLPQPVTDLEPGVQVLALSAQSPAALHELARAWIPFLGNTPANLQDVCCTAAQRRTHYDHRVAVTGRTREELAARLSNYLAGAPAPGLVSGQRRTASVSRIGFVFSGQGPQWYAMGRELLATEPVFRTALTGCDTALRAVSGWSLLAELAQPDESSRLNETEVAQPALFALQVSLAALWKSWGVLPDAIVGHSVGEIAALHVAGVLDLGAAARVVCHRGRIMQQATGLGRMASVALTEAEAVALVSRFADKLSVGAINSPRGVVLSGESAALDEALSELDHRDLGHRMLPVQYAFHSAQMAPFEQRLAAELQGLRSSAPLIDFYSTVTGAQAADLSFNAEYFGRNVRAPVRFAAAIAAMADDGCDVFVEISPHPVLGGAIAECLAEREQPPAIVASLRRGRPERETLLQACAGVYAAGCELDWATVQAIDANPVPLPAYPWQRKRHWIRKAPARVERREPGGAVHPILGAPVPAAGIEAQIFAGDSERARAWLGDHRIFGRLVLPAAAVLDAFATAASRALGYDRPQLQDFAMHRPLFLPEEGAGTAQWQVLVGKPEGRPAELSLFELLAAPPGGKTQWQRVASAVCVDGIDAAAPRGDCSEPLESLDVGETYKRFQHLDVEFGPAFQRLEGIERGTGYAHATIQLPESLVGEAGLCSLHPVLIDAGLQLCSLAATRGPDGGLPARVFLPLGADRVTLYPGTYSRLRGRALINDGAGATSATLSADVVLESEQGEPVAVIEGMRFAPAAPESFALAAPSGNLSYEIAWYRAAPSPVSGPRSARGLWLLFADGRGIGDALAARIEAAGGRCYRIYVGDEFARTADDRLTVDPANPAHFAQMLQAVDWSSANVPRGVVHCWGLDVGTFASPLGAELERDDLLASASVLHLVQALARAGVNSDSRLWLVTSGAQLVTGQEPAQSLRPQAAAAWGLAGVIALEHPELQVRALDMDPTGAVSAIDGVFAELLDAGQLRLALRGGQRWVPRLERHRPSTRTPVSKTEPRSWKVVRPGTLDGLELRSLQALPLRADELRLRVLAAGLNFRDVLLTLGMYPGGGVPLGAECAGVVLEVGPGVAGFKVGDRVFGYASASLSTEVVAVADHVAHLPPSLQVEAAAGLAVAYLTAFYGLHNLARTRAGERVLIHAAAGGVGFAAVQLAQRRGAEVFATAGSDEKRKFLRSCGVAHVFDSRSLDFAEHVLAATGGRGVNVVLNSLAGEFIPASLRTLATGGCFLELGKRNVWTPEAVALARPDVRYFVYDLGSEAESNRALLRPMFDEILAALAEGSLRTLPVKVFELEAVGEAMRYMAQAHHIGKIVIRVASEGDLRTTSDGLHVQSDATYWITGGLGALGLATARWLVGNGARHLVLSGRSAPTSGAQSAVRDLEQQGARVHCVAADIGDRAAVSTILQGIRREGPPLRGVIHAAGALHDGVLLRQEWPLAREVLRGKAHGAWLLDELTREDSLDFFVLYSAAGALLGASGQGLYPAANAQLDALAQARRRSGLPAQSVAWGAWAGGGMAATAALQGRDIWEARGLGKLTPETGFGELARLAADETAFAAVIAIDWTRFLAQLPAGADREFFAGLAIGAASAATPAPSAPATAAAHVIERLRALPSGQRRQALAAHLTSQALQVLGLDAATSVDTRAPLKDIGLDSLMSVELRNTLNRSAPRPLPATLLFDYPTLDALTSFLARSWGLDTDGPAPAVSPIATAQAAAQTAIEKLSDDEAEALLLAELNELHAGRGS